MPTNDIFEPILGTLKLDFPSYLTTPHFWSPTAINFEARYDLESTDFAMLKLGEKILLHLFYDYVNYPHIGLYVLVKHKTHEIWE